MKLALRVYKKENIGNLFGYEANSRTHSEAQIAKLVKSIKRWGFTNPLLIDENNTIIAGHARLAAAKECGLDALPCIVVDGLSDEDRAALVIADNQLAITGSGWDQDILRSQLTFLKDNDYDLELTGFGLDELCDILPDDKPAAFCDEDDCPDAPEEPIAKLGDVWLLGSHRLMCGDSTSIDAVDRLMGGVKADMVFTDPPYGVNFKQGKFCGQTANMKKRNFDPIINDDKQGTELEEFLRQVFSNLFAVTDVCSIYSWSPPMAEGFYILNALIKSGWHIQSQIIWNKSSLVMGRCDYQWKHEVCWYGYKGKNHKWEGGRTKVTVWDVKKQPASDLHPTMKPVELAEIACMNSTKSGDNVIDLFGGSGSTLIACEKLGRKCYMMELDPVYASVIIKRYENYTGNKAVLEDKYA